jgi:hypothetical protein
MSIYILLSQSTILLATITADIVTGIIESVSGSANEALA